MRIKATVRPNEAGIAKIMEHLPKFGIVVPGVVGLSRSTPFQTLDAYYPTSTMIQKYFEYS
jgi:hypothetical protein